MKNISMLALLIVVVIAASCHTQKDTGSTAKISKSVSTLSQTNWQLFSMNGQKISVPDGGNIPTLSFDPAKMTVSGNSGCNTFSGGFISEKDALSFGNLASTRMMCPDMKMETSFLGTIMNTKKFTIYEGKLVLNDADGKQLMSFDPLQK